MEYSVPRCKWILKLVLIVGYKKSSHHAATRKLFMIGETASGNFPIGLKVRFIDANGDGLFKNDNFIEIGEYHA